MSFRVLSLMEIIPLILFSAVADTSTGVILEFSLKYIFSSTTVYEKLRTSGNAGIDKSSSNSSPICTSVICPWIFLTATSSSSSRLLSSYGIQVDSGPKRPETIFILPSTISGLSTKYLFILIPSSVLSSCTQLGSISSTLSRFWRTRISDTTSVPALPLKVSLGSLIATRRSALWAIYLLILLLSLSIVPLEVMSIIMPPVLTLSSDFIKK